MTRQPGSGGTAPERFAGAIARWAAGASCPYPMQAQLTGAGALTRSAASQARHPGPSAARRRELREAPATDQAIQADAAPAAPRRAVRAAAPAVTVADRRAGTVKER